jgi:hypothetical protein
MSKQHVLYCSGSGICTVHVPVPVLFLFRYPHCRSSDTPSHPVPEGSTVNRYLHSHLVPTLHVIQYSAVIQYYLCIHPVPALCLFRYQLHPVPDCAYSGTSSIQYYHRIGPVPIVMTVFIWY